MSDLVWSRISGAMLGTAIGDALGNVPGKGVDILDGDHAEGSHEAERRHGEGRLTACTQLVLFTAEALVLAGVELEQRGTCLPSALLFEAYRRWWAIQEGSRAPSLDGESRGWLESVELLAEVSHPDATTLDVLSAGSGGRLSARVNEVNDDGALPRAVPAGFLVPGMAPGASTGEAYYLGCEIAAVTHGHDDAINAGGALATIVEGLVVGNDVAEAIRGAHELTTPPVAQALERALEAGASSAAAIEQAGLRGDARYEALESLELALICAQSTSLESALAGVAVLPGSVGTIGSICGALIGARDGIESMPLSLRAWLDDEGVVAEVTHDCVAWLRWLESADQDVELDAAWLARYA